MTNPIDKAQPEALRLADSLEGNAKAPWTRDEVSKELRRLHAEVEALEAENDLLRQHSAKQINDATLLTGISIGNGSMDIGMQGGAARLLADSFFDQFIESGAVNYLEVRFDSPEKMPGKSMVVTLQLVDGLTPAQKIAELKAELATQAAQIEACRADAARLDYLIDGEGSRCWVLPVIQGDTWKQGYCLQWMDGNDRITWQKGFFGTAREAIDAAIQARAAASIGAKGDAS